MPPEMKPLPVYCSVQLPYSRSAFSFLFHVISSSSESNRPGGRGRETMEGTRKKDVSEHKGEKMTEVIDKLDPRAGG